MPHDNDHRSIGARRILRLHPRVDPAHWTLQPLLELTRDVLGMDLALLTEIVDNREVTHHTAGSWPGPHPAALIEASLVLTGTFCQRLLDGKIAHALPDVRCDPRVKDLALAHTLGVGAWMGTALHTEQDRRFMLCCLAREQRPIHPRDVPVLQALGASLAQQLDKNAPEP